MLISFILYVNKKYAFIFYDRYQKEIILVPFAARRRDERERRRESNAIVNINSQKKDKTSTSLVLDLNSVNGAAMKRHEN